jgi:hypothetical protein
MNPQSNKHLHIITSPQSIPGEVSIIRSVSTIITNGLYSSQNQPIYDLDFSQFLSPELNVSYDINRVLSAELIADAMSAPLDIEQESVLSPVGAWLCEYYPPPLASLEQEVEVVAVVTRMERNDLIKSAVEKNPISDTIHSCPQCDRKFTRRFNMLTHMKTHDKSRFVK